MSYKGFKGYMPMVGHLAENGMVVGDEFREGNDSPSARNLEFITYCRKQLPKGKKLKALRSDSAGYQADIINYCEKEGIEYAIGAVLDEAVMGAIESIGADEWRPYQNGYIAETVHCMEKTEEAFRLVVIRRAYQKEMFGEEDVGLKYKAVATNKKERGEEILGWYNQRGDCSENRIKELKIGFGMERMPCGQYMANAVFFRIGAIAYNLYRLFVLKVLEKGWHRHQVQTVRWRLYANAGKIVFHGGQVYLKVRQRVCELFQEIRHRIWEFAQT
jgi:hypothetical protein